MPLDCPPVCEVVSSFLFLLLLFDEFIVLQVLLFVN